MESRVSVFAGSSLVALVLACALQVVGATDTKEATQKAHEAVMAESTPETVKAFLATLPRYGQFYVLEGDLLRTEAEIKRDLLLMQGRSASLAQQNPELIVNLTAAGARDYWKDPSARKLTYAVDRASFKSEARANQITTQMEAAAQDWVQRCEECGISITRLDIPNPTHKQVTFVVRRANANGAFIAAAFFPSYPAARRYVDIDDSFFALATNSFDPVGVLRHELGHVLGYRHEHIRGISGCFQEGASWSPLTPYDPNSVMHYFCGGAGSLELAISDLDEEGHRRLYAPPSANGQE